MSQSEDEALERILRLVAETPRVLRPKGPVAVGTVLADRFVIEGELGSGGMGRVFRALDRVRQTRVAAKVLGSMTTASIAEIKREFRAAEALTHENLVRLHELFCDDERWFFTMDLVDGVTLPELLSAHPSRRRQPGFLRGIFLQLANGLRALHAAPVLHRDLKPSNFLIARAELRVTLLDFGLARPPGGAEEQLVEGTPSYMSPEQALGEVLTEAADWYSFGVVLYEALAGALPRGPSPERLIADAPDGLGPLCLQLLSPDPARRPGGEEILRALGGEESPGRGPAPLPKLGLIGRTAELAILDEALARAGRGRSVFVSVNGPSGMGKTALVDGFVQRAVRRGAIVLSGRCRERESMAYKAVDGLVDSLVHFLASLPEREAASSIPRDMGDLTVMFPALRDAPIMSSLPLSPPLIADRGVVRRRAVAAFTSLIGHLRRRSPVIIWVDDLQWSDRESALLMGPLLAELENPGILFVGTTRSEEGTRAPFLEALTTDASVVLPPLEDLLLGPLPENMAERLVQEILSDGSLGGAEARRVAREAGGHPLFVAEIAYSLRLDLAHKGDGGATLASLIGRRLDALPAAARALLELCAVAEAPMRRDVLAAVQGLERSACETWLDLLRGQRLVRSQGLMETDAVDVQHDRIREIVLRTLSTARRRACHLLLARALEPRPWASPNTLATHFEAAGQLEDAGRHWLAAADKAWRALAFAHAAALYERALAQAKLSPADRQTVTVRRAEALVYAGRGMEAAVLYLELAEGGSEDEGLELRRLAAEQLLLCGDLPRGMAVLDDVLRDIGMPRPKQGRRALVSIAVDRIRLRVRGLKYTSQAGGLGARDRARLDASWTVACSLGAIDFIRGAEFQTKHLLMALDAGEPRRLLRALTLEAAYAAAPGRGSEARTERLLTLADALAQEEGDAASDSLLCLNRGISAYLQSQLGPALHHLEEALYVLSRRSVGAVWEMVTAQRFVVATLFFLGRLRQLQEFLPPLLREAEQNGNRYASMCFRSAYATTSWLCLDRPGEARDQLARARADWKASSFQISHCNLLIGEAFVDFYEGRGPEAWERIERAWPFFERAQLHRVSVLRVQLAHMLASGALCAARQEQGRGQLSRARTLRGLVRKLAQRLRREPVARAAAFSEMLQAALLQAEGAEEASRLHLERAIKIFSAQSMKLFAAAARSRLGQVIGGDEGATLRAAASADFRDEGIVDPLRMVGMLAPASL